MKKFATASGAPPVLHRNSANLMQNMLDEVKASITILPELQGLIPPLQTVEFDQLKENIRQDGCREALLVWQTTNRVIGHSADDTPLNVLIDGHNRYTICTQYKIDFKVMLREFPSLQAVRDFMIDNQLGRRNLSPEQMSYLRGLKYRNERQAAGRPAMADSESDQATDDKISQRTQDRLAREFNVSPRTIHRDKEYSEGIDKLTDDLKKDVLSGKKKVSKEVIRAVGRSAPSSNAPLALPELLAYTEHETAGSAQALATTSAKESKLLRKIIDRASKLDPASPKFQITCDELIALVMEAKKIG